MEAETTSLSDDRDLRLLAVAAAGIIVIALIIAAAIISARRTEETDAESDADTLEPKEVATIAIEPEAKPIDQPAEAAATRL